MKKFFCFFAAVFFLSAFASARPLADSESPWTGSSGRGESFYVSAGGNDEENGLSPETAFKTLSKALAAVQESGLRRITVLGKLDMESEWGGDGPSRYSGDMDWVFYIIDSGPDEILITGGDGPEEKAVLQGAPGYGVLCVTEGSHIRLENILITGGDAASLGGGIFAYASAVTIRGNARIADNSAGRNGGGIYAAGGDEPGREPAVIIEGNSVIENNRAGNDGGGVCLDDGQRLIVRGGAVIRSNRSADDGGGIYGTGESRVTLMENARLLDNEAPCGGGLCVDSFSSAVVQDKVLVRSNRSTGERQGGGGLCMGIGASIIMKGGEVRENEARLGGGVYVEGGVFKQSGGIIAGNTAVSGGGLYVASGSATLGRRALIEDNDAYIGGGVYISAGTVRLFGVIRANHADEAGGGSFAEERGRLIIKNGGSVRENIPGNGVPADSIPIPK